jgi:hypothetical protein
MCLVAAATAHAAEPDNHGATMNAAQPAIVRDATDAAEWMAKRLLDAGYKADFSLESLREVDRFLDEQASKGKPKPGGLLSHDFGMQIFALGAYIGETIRREGGGGRWEGNDGDAHPEISLAVRLKSGVVFWPTQRVLKRFKNGPEDSIYPYGALMLRD